MNQKIIKKVLEKLDEINGCNLYKFFTFRRHWQDEGQRLTVLDEKHARGETARRDSATRLAREDYNEWV